MLTRYMIRPFFYVIGGLLLLLSACSSQNIDLPTLVPTFQPRPTATDSSTSVPTLQLTATDVPTVTSAPTQTIFPTLRPVITLLPPLVVTASGTTTITLSAAQLDDALARRFTTNPLPDYTAPPHVIFASGQIQLDLSIAPRTATPQPITLTLALTALNTTEGSVLEVRATGVSALNGITTQQVKKSQALLKATLEDIAQRTVGSSTITFSYVSITDDALSLTVFIP